MRRTKSRKKDGFERGDYKKKSCAGGSELYREIGYVSKRKGLTRKGWRKDRRWGGGRGCDPQRNYGLSKRRRN